MFRDSRGVVHTVCSADPLVDLPPGAALALQGALLSTDRPVDVGSVLERCDAVRELVERWQDAFFAGLPDEVDAAEEARWAAEAGLSLQELEAGWSEVDDPDEHEVVAHDAEDVLDDDDVTFDDRTFDDKIGLVELVEPDEQDPRRVLPEQLVAVLERELLLLPLRVRLEALVAAVDLVETWGELIADQEKLLGHLVLSHAQAQEATAHEALVEHHAALHAVSGPHH